MLRSLVAFLLLVSCSIGVHKSGGDETYLYDVVSDYRSDELEELAPKLISVSHRNPPKGELNALFRDKQPPIKRIGIIIFESAIQPTLGGLSGQDLVYLSEGGKQLITERLLAIWEQSLPILGKGLTYVPTSKVRKAKSFSAYGSLQEDFIKGRRSRIEPDDIFYTPAGKKTTLATTINPRRMRDLSIALVPGSELLQGPKFSEHQKHAVNELCRELKLDAVLVLMSKINWTAARKDKHSGEFVPEEVQLDLKGTIVVPFSNYHERLQRLGEKRDLPMVNVAYGFYQGKVHFPVLLSVPQQMQTFETIETELLTPMLKTYKDLSQMMIFEMVKDLSRTHHG